MHSIDIIIVNWNAGKQLADCLASIAQFSAGVVSKVVVVDNASTDGSDKDLQCFGLPLKVIRNEKNKGFGVACNQGAALCDAPYLLFLNPDARLMPHSLEVPLAFMENTQNQNTGIVGIQLLDEKGAIVHSCARFPTASQFFAKMLGLDRLFPGLFFSHFMREWDHSETRIVDQVMGAFFFVRSSLFDRLNGFDQRFFVYFEEVDFSYRANKLGWKTTYLSTAQAFHKGGGTSEQIKARRLFYSLRSRILYGFKNFSFWQAWCLMVITLGIEPVTRSVFSLMNSGVDGVRNTWRAYGMLWNWCYKWLQNR